MFSPITSTVVHPRGGVRIAHLFSVLCCIGFILSMLCVLYPILSVFLEFIPGFKKWASCYKLCPIMRLCVIFLPFLCQLPFR